MGRKEERLHRSGDAVVSGLARRGQPLGCGRPGWLGVWPGRAAVETRADGPDARNSAGAMHAAIGRQAVQRFSGTVRGTIQSYGGFPAGPRPVR
jgi:hypothetical protein